MRSTAVCPATGRRFSGGKTIRGLEGHKASRKPAYFPRRFQRITEHVMIGNFWRARSPNRFVEWEPLFWLYFTLWDRFSSFFLKYFIRLSEGINSNCTNGIYLWIMLLDVYIRRVCYREYEYFFIFSTLVERKSRKVTCI